MPHRRRAISVKVVRDRVIPDRVINFRIVQPVNARQTNAGPVNAARINSAIRLRPIVPTILPDGLAQRPIAQATASAARGSNVHKDGPTRLHGPASLINGNHNQKLPAYAGAAFLRDPHEPLVFSDDLDAEAFGLRQLRARPRPGHHEISFL